MAFLLSRGVSVVYAFFPVGFISWLYAYNAERVRDEYEARHQRKGAALIRYEENRFMREQKNKQMIGQGHELVVEIKSTVKTHEERGAREENGSRFSCCSRNLEYHTGENSTGGIG